MVFLLQLLGCGDGSSDSSDRPALEMVSPANGDTVCGRPLLIETDIENFSLTNKDLEDSPPDLGHLHVYLNGQEVAQAGRETVEVNDVADGEYQLKADLALANHEALVPYVGTDPIYITVDVMLCP
jgi:hypothetical protein